MSFFTNTLGGNPFSTPVGSKIGELIICLLSPNAFGFIYNSAIYSVVIFCKLSNDYKEKFCLYVQKA